MNTDNRIPENLSWHEVEWQLIESVMKQNDTLAEEVIAQAKRHTKFWFVAWLITLAVLTGTNAAWIYVFQSYDYVSQDGSGVNSYNTEIKGDLYNGPEDQR